MEIASGQAVPFHRHPGMEEVLYVLAGQIEQWIDQKSTSLSPGDSATIPQDAVHATRNLQSSTAEVLLMHSPVRNDVDSTVDVSKSEPWKSLALKGRFPDFDIRQRKDTLVARLTNRDLIDQSSIATFRSALADLDGAFSPRRLVIDFSGTGILSSTVLGILMERYKLMNGSQRAICVCGLSKETQEVFDLTQLTRCVPTFPTAEMAIAASQ